MNLDMEGPVLWGVEGQCESLKAESLDDAITEWLEECTPSEIGADFVLVVVPHRRVKLTAADVERAVGRFTLAERALEDLNEEYGSDDSSWEPPPPTKRMYDAEKALYEAIAAEYECWRCEEIAGTTHLSVAAWIRENEPRWLQHGEEWHHLATEACPLCIAEVSHCGDDDGDQEPDDDEGEAVPK